MRLPFAVPFLHGFRGGDGRAGQKRSAADCGSNLRRMIGLALAGVRCPHSVPHGASDKAAQSFPSGCQHRQRYAGGIAIGAAKRLWYPSACRILYCTVQRAKRCFLPGCFRDRRQPSGLPCRAVMRASGLRYVRTNACVRREYRALRTAASGGAA